MGKGSCLVLSSAQQRKKGRLGGRKPPPPTLNSELKRTLGTLLPETSSGSITAGKGFILIN